MILVQLTNVRINRLQQYPVTMCPYTSQYTAMRQGEVKIGLAENLLIEQKKLVYWGVIIH